MDVTTVTIEEASKLTGRDLGRLRAFVEAGRVRIVETDDKAGWELPDWKAQPKQEAFLACDAFIALFGGSAGGGKTDACLMYSILRRKEHPGSKGVIFRRTYTDLTEIGAIVDRSHELLDGGGWRWNGGKLRWTAPDGGIIEFKHCPTTWDEFKRMAQGLQADDAVIDEAGQWTGRHLLYLYSRVRATVAGITPQIRLTANPMGVGHTFLKTFFIEPSRGREGVTWAPEPSPELPEPKTRAFIPSRVYDNLALMERDPGYIASLQALPDQDRKALLEGDWDYFAGQFFSEFDASVHLVDGSPVDFPPRWNRILGIDWGFNHPTAALWGVVDPDGIVTLYRERWWRFKHVDGEDGLVARLKEFSDTPPTAAAGPDVFSMAHTMLGGPNIAEEFTNSGLYLDNVCAGRKRHHTWMQVRRFLQWRDAFGGKVPGRPLLRILRGTCPRLVEQLQAMIPDPNDPEDVLKQNIDPTTGEGGDDLVDCLGHVLMGRPWASEREEPFTLSRYSMAGQQAEKDRKRRETAKSSLVR